MPQRYTLSELARMAGIPASTIHFYKHHRLLPPSYGVGRGANYGEEHWKRLQRIAEYRQLGYSLAAIRVIFEGMVDEMPTPTELKGVGVEKGMDRKKMERLDTRSSQAVNPNNTRTMVSEAWGRVKLFPGLELHYELGKYVVFPRNVEELREAMRAILVAGG